MRISSNKRETGYRHYIPLACGRYCVSIQASKFHYCTPPKLLENLYDYSEMEVAVLMPNDFDDDSEIVNIVMDPFFDDWQSETFHECFDGCVAAYVPVETIQDFVDYVEKREAGLI
jgi:hypothetical protein